MASKKHIPDPHRVALGQRVEVVALSLGSRAKAAEVAGITTQHLGQLILGKGGEPSAITLARLCAASGHSLDWLLTGEGAERRDPKGREARFVKKAASDPALAETVVQATKDGATNRRVLRALQPLGQIWLEAGHPMGAQDLIQMMDELLSEMEDAGLPFAEWPRAATVALAAHRQALRILGGRQEPR